MYYIHVNNELTTNKCNILYNQLPRGHSVILAAAVFFSVIGRQNDQVECSLHILITQQVHNTHSYV